MYILFLSGCGIWSRPSSYKKRFISKTIVRYPNHQTEFINIYVVLIPFLCLFIDKSHSALQSSTLVYRLYHFSVQQGVIQNNMCSQMMFHIIFMSLQLIFIHSNLLYMFTTLTNLSYCFFYYVSCDSIPGLSKQQLVFCSFDFQVTHKEFDKVAECQIVV